MKIITINSIIESLFAGGAVMDEDNIRIGRLLQVAREQHKVSQAALCDATGLSKNHISAVERGLSKASVKMLLGYCKKLGITPNDILGYGELNLMPELKDMLSSMDTEQQQKVLDIIKLMIR